ncbi:hypothetical protein RB620_23100, partial [Paenibacillus sp. LHD-117]|uniref:hypothetical protein n=1 Tax=Paenibacillus sp. LHD-117 TaxID=3071412 RepID=UPI0027E05E43
ALLRIRLVKAYEIVDFQGFVSPKSPIISKDIPVRKGILRDYWGDFQKSRGFPFFSLHFYDY